MELNDLMDLDELASALQTCSRYGIRSMEDFGRRMLTKAASSPRIMEELSRAQAYMAENRLLPQRIEHKQAAAKRQVSQQQNARTDTAKRQRQIQAQQQEQQRQRRKER